jgi:hypothetical protein
VIGIVTQESGGDEGDNFAAAIPISIAVSMLSSAGVAVPANGTYAAHASKGLELAENNDCTAALVELRAAEEYTSDFGTANSYLADRIVHCEKAAVIEANKRATAKLVEDSHSTKQSLVNGALLFGGALAFIGTVTAIVLRRRKNAVLANYSQGNISIHVPTPQAPVPLDENIVQYVKEMRGQNASDADIAAALKSSGWIDNTIARAIAEVR